jgi:hypothetical protein
MQAESEASNSHLRPPKTWVDDLYAKVGVNVVLVSAFCGTTVYVIGLAISVVVGFQATYLTTIPVYYGAFGILWVMGSIRWGLLLLPKKLDYARVCFKDEKRFVKMTDDCIRGLSSRKGAFWTSTVVFLFGLVGLILGLFVFGQDVERRVFPNPWYEGPVFGQTLILVVFDIGCSLPLGTGLWLVYKNAMFLWALRHLEVIPFPGILIARLRHVTAFYLTAALTWFVGVALFGLLSFRHLDLLSIVILTITAAFGLVTSLGPQILFHRFITRASSEAAGEFARVFKGELDGKIDFANLPQVTSILQASQPGQTWVINLKDLLLLAGGQLLPVVAVAVKGMLG